MHRKDSSTQFRSHQGPGHGDDQGRANSLGEHLRDKTRGPGASWGEAGVQGAGTEVPLNTAPAAVLRTQERAGLEPKVQFGAEMRRTGSPEAALGTPCADGVRASVPNLGSDPGGSTAHQPGRRVRG